MAFIEMMHTQDIVNLYSGNSSFYVLRSLCSCVHTRTKDLYGEQTHGLLDKPFLWNSNCRLGTTKHQMT